MRPRKPEDEPSRRNRARSRWYRRREGAPPIPGPPARWSTQEPQRDPGSRLALFRPPTMRCRDGWTDRLPGYAPAKSKERAARRSQLGTGATQKASKEAWKRPLPQVREIEPMSLPRESFV